MQQQNWLQRTNHVIRLTDQEHRIDAMLHSLDEFSVMLPRAAQMNEAVEVEIGKIPNTEIRLAMEVRLEQVRRAMGWKLVNPAEESESDGER